jgi:hypothetical protein
MTCLPGIRYRDRQAQLGGSRYADLSDIGKEKEIPLFLPYGTTAAIVYFFRFRR